MPNKQASCGTINLLNELRESQDLPTSNEESAINKYIRISEEEIIDSSFTPPPSSNKLSIQKIYDIDPELIDLWEYKDRPDEELGNIEELAETFKNVGQQQPCILRHSKSSPERYELIVGERRWRAAKFANLQLKAIIKDIDDKVATLIQAVENEKRKDLSDFAKARSYINKIEAGLITQKDLVDILKIDKKQVSRLLSFRKIPKPLCDAIGNFRNVSARTAYELSRLGNKNKEYLEYLISISNKIKTGEWGQKRIENGLKKHLEKRNISKKVNQRILDIDGRHLFTWRMDNNIPSIHFPKGIINLIITGEIPLEELTNQFKKCLLDKLNGDK